MVEIDEAAFWEWLKQKELDKTQKDFEQIPLYITVVEPEQPRQNDEQSSDTEVDYTVDDSVVFQF